MIQSPASSAGTAGLETKKPPGSNPMANEYLTCNIEA